VGRYGVKQFHTSHIHARWMLVLPPEKNAKTGGRGFSVMEPDIYMPGCLCGCKVLSNTYYVTNEN